MSQKTINLNFLKLTPFYLGLSAIVLAISIISLVLFGLNPSIDFTGGSLYEIAINSETQIDTQTLTQTIETVAPINSLQPTGDTYIIRAQEMNYEDTFEINQLIETEFGPVEELRFETVGPILGEELLQKTLYAVLLGSLAIMLYVAYQFKEFKYGVCAILAMLHDTLIVLGVFSLLGRFYQIEVDTLFVTALLTTLSFSIHDTIVVYDRIRESLHRSGLSDFPTIVNKSIAETLGRSINNSMTIIFMLTALFLLGGDSIRWFVFALLVGTITGTYSSTFTAAPLLVIWDKFQKTRGLAKSR